MADALLKGVNYTKTNNPVPSNILARGKVAGVVKVLTDQYDASATNIDTDDTCKIGKDLKAGDIIVGAQISSAAAVSGCTLALGDSDDPNRYLEQDVSSTTKTNDLLHTGYNYVIGTNDGDTTLVISASGAAADQVINVTVFYIES